MVMRYPSLFSFDLIIGARCASLAGAVVRAGSAALFAAIIALQLGDDAGDPVSVGGKLL
jgi:hypothetical protein